MARLIMVEALNLALKQEMARDPTVMVLGEDVGKDGGVFRVSDGLIKLYGEERVVDTPLAESGIVGTGIGLAIAGLRPVCEIQFDGFIPPAFDQLISHASRVRWRSQGRFTCPLVMRAPFMGGVRALEHHSESTEAIYAHIPGLKVVVPATPYDAKGLLIAAIRDPDPVLFCEPKRVYRAFREEVPEDEYTVPLGVAKMVTEGSDVTLVTWGAMRWVCEQALVNLQNNGLPGSGSLAGKKPSIELIDLRTISPWDSDMVISSVKKTGRCVIVHEAPLSGGFGGEISATIMEKALYNLKAPVVRVTGFDTPPPYLKTEHYYLPNEKRILDGVKKVLAS